MIVMGLAAVSDGEESDEPVMHEIHVALEDVFPVRVRRTAPVPLPDCYDAARRQHSAPAILKSALTAAPAGCEKFLVITARDLFIPMLSFVYGQAQLGGRVAIVSLARLRQEFYGMEPNARLLAARARKEAVHETGHLFGLVHCDAPACAMRLSTFIQQIDGKDERLCAGCAAGVMEKIR